MIKHSNYIPFLANFHLMNFASKSLFAIMNFNSPFLSIGREFENSREFLEKWLTLLSLSDFLSISESRWSNFNHVVHTRSCLNLNPHSFPSNPRGFAFQPNPAMWKPTFRGKISVNDIFYIFCFLKRVLFGSGCKPLHATDNRSCQLLPLPQHCASRSQGLYCFHFCPPPPPPPTLFSFLSLSLLSSLIRYDSCFGSSMCLQICCSCCLHIYFTIHLQMGQNDNYLFKRWHLLFTLLSFSFVFTSHLSCWVSTIEWRLMSAEILSTLYCIAISEIDNWFFEHNFPLK